MADTPEQPKIIIDSDWKSQAQAEKERLAAKEREAAAKAPPAGAGGAAGPGAGGREELPPADFQSLIGTLVTQALIYLGGFPDPQTGRAIFSPEHARFHIDLLGVLEVKCKGNLTAEEEADLTQALHELRLRYVEIGRAVQAMAAREKAGAAGQMGPRPG